jgi:hypothetical protein
LAKKQQHNKQEECFAQLPRFDLQALELLSFYPGLAFQPANRCAGGLVLDCCCVLGLLAPRVADKAAEADPGRWRGQFAFGSATQNVI